MRTLIIPKYLGYAFLLAAAFAFPAFAIASQQGNEQREKEAEQREERKLKIFELEHRDPQELALIIRLNWQPTFLRPFHHPVLGPIGQPDQPDQADPPRAATQPQRDAQEVMVAADSKNRLLFVRAKEDQIQKIKELVEAFDREGEELEAKRFGELHLLPVSRDKVRQVCQILVRLEIPCQVLTLGKRGTLIVVHGEGDRGEARAEQVKEIIDRMDAATPAENERGKGNDHR